MKTRTQKTAIFVIFLMDLLVPFVVSCDKDDQSYDPAEIKGVIWGTSYTIIYNEEGAATDITETVTKALNKVDRTANAFNSTSELSILNRNKTLDNPSELLIYLCNKSATISSFTGGAFDPTVGPAVDMWGFGSGEAKISPSQEEIDSVLESVGMDKVIVSDKDIKFESSETRLDFGAIAKGYGVDYVTQALEKAGVKDFMVEIGGEVRVKGRSPRGDLWSVQIDAPIPDRSGTHRRLLVVGLNDIAVATSGNYRNFRFDANGKPVYHTISPKTGRPVETDLLSATIFAADATTADALATASMVMGLSEASEMIESISGNNEIGVAGAIFVTASDNSEERFKIHYVALNPEKIFIDN